MGIVRCRSLNPKRLSAVSMRCSYVHPSRCSISAVRASYRFSSPFCRSPAGPSASARATSASSASIRRIGSNTSRSTASIAAEPLSSENCEK